MFLYGRPGLGIFEDLVENENIPFVYTFTYCKISCEIKIFQSNKNVIVNLAQAST